MFSSVSILYSMAKALTDSAAIVMSISANPVNRLK